MATLAAPVAAESAMVGAMAAGLSCGAGLCGRSDLALSFNLQEAQLAGFEGVKCPSPLGGDEDNGHGVGDDALSCRSTEAAASDSDQLSLRGDEGFEADEEFELEHCSEDSSVLTEGEVSAQRRSTGSAEAPADSETDSFDDGEASIDMGLEREIHLARMNSMINSGLWQIRAISSPRTPQKSGGYVVSPKGCIVPNGRARMSPESAMRARRMYIRQKCRETNAALLRQEEAWQEESGSVKLQEAGKLSPPGQTGTRKSISAPDASIGMRTFVRWCFPLEQGPGTQYGPNTPTRTDSRTQFGLLRVSGLTGLRMAVMESKETPRSQRRDVKVVRNSYLSRLGIGRQAPPQASEEEVAQLDSPALLRRSVSDPEVNSVGAGISTPFWSPSVLRRTGSLECMKNPLDYRKKEQSSGSKSPKSSAAPPQTSSMDYLGGWAM